MNLNKSNRTFSVILIIVCLFAIYYDYTQYARLSIPSIIFAIGIVYMLYQFIKDYLNKE